MINIFNNSNGITEILTDGKAINIFSTIQNFIETQNLEELNNYITKHIDYLNSNEWVSNLKKLMETDWEKYYPILWSIDRVFHISSKKTKDELAEVFFQTNKETKKLIKENEELKKEIEKLNKLFQQLNNDIKILTNENWVLTEENKYLRPVAEKYSKLLEILIESWLLDKWYTISETIIKIIELNKISQKLVNLLLEKWILIRVNNWWIKISPEAKIIMDAFKKAVEESLKWEIETEVTRETWNSDIIDPSNPNHNIKKYQLPPFEEKTNKTKPTKKELGELKELNEKLLKKDKELKKQAEEIERLKKELLEGKWSKTKEWDETEKWKRKWTNPKHIETAIKTYTENQ